MNDEERVVMQQALDALETLDCGDSYKTHNAAAALRRVLEQPVNVERLLMSKLEQAARQALEALNGLIAQNGIGIPATSIELTALSTITALREALAEQTAKEKAESYREGYMDGRRDSKLAEQAEQEPVGVVEGSVEWGIAGVLVSGVPIGTKLYAAPVRTKDLTEEDINELWNTALMIADPTAGNLRFKFARAVIAKLREKERLK